MTIGIIFSYMVIGIAVWSFVCAVMDEPKPGAGETMVGVAIWPLIALVISVAFIVEGVKFLFEKMIRFWQAVLPIDEEDS